MNVLVINCGSSSLKYRNRSSTGKRSLREDRDRRKISLPENRSRQRDYRSSYANTQTGDPDGTGCYRKS
jgi:acetate kinase